MSEVTKLAGVCGWPIHHSLSPLLHNYWLRDLGIPGAYVHFAVRPDEAVKAFQSLKHTSITGVNVTLPLKSLAFQAADEHSSDALKLGVSNCLYKKNGLLIAHNTDMEGFAEPLLEALGADELSRRSVLVIGTGGAAKAVIGALLSMNIPEIKICGRNDEMSQNLVASVNLPSFYNIPWSQRHLAVSNAGLIVNASAGGMKGKGPLDLDLSRISPDCFVYDLIYTPTHTPLLMAAKRKGCQTLGGLDMLIAQAKPSFRYFYGQPPRKESSPRDMLLKELQDQM